MDKNIRNGVGFAIIAALMFFIIGGITVISAFGKGIDPTRTFTVSAQGEVTSVPDIAKFTLNVLTQGGLDLGAAQTENTNKGNAVLSFIKQNGVDEKDIKTQQYTIEPRYQYYDCRYDGTACPAPKIIGYTVSQSMQVKLRDFAKIGVLLSGVVEKGANGVYDLSFIFDDPTKLQNEARGEAVSKAKQQADVLATAAGFKIGKLLSITESSNYYPYASKEQFGMGAASPVAPDIAPGTQNISVNVNLIFEIK